MSNFFWDILYIVSKTPNTFFVSATLKYITSSLISQPCSFFTSISRCTAYPLTTCYCEIEIQSWLLTDHLVFTHKFKIFHLILLCHFYRLLRRGSQINFWLGEWSKIWNPYPFLKIFSPRKMTDLTFFLFVLFFAKRYPFLRAFLPQRIFTVLVR